MTLLPPGTYALCSDLHEGDGSARDDFHEGAHWFLAEVAALPVDTRPVIVGDYKDALRYDLNAILSVPVYAEIDRQLAARGAVLVRGNHDPSVKTLHEVMPAGFLVCERINIGGYYVCHGQEWDLVNGRWHSVGDALTRVAALAGRLSSRLEDWLAEVADKARGTGRHGEERRFIDTALDHIRYWPGVRGVICGHTHKARRLTDADGGKEYVNLGTWRTDGFTVIEIGP